MMRDFATLKDLYSHKLTQQEQLTKQLRTRQKDLKENSGVMTNQNTNFMNLQMLLHSNMQIDGTGASGRILSVGGITASAAAAGGPAGTASPTPVGLRSRLNAWAQGRRVRGGPRKTPSFWMPRLGFALRARARLGARPRLLRAALGP